MTKPSKVDSKFTISTLCKIYKAVPGLLLVRNTCSLPNYIPMLNEGDYGAMSMTSHFHRDLSVSVVEPMITTFGL